MVDNRILRGNMVEIWTLEIGWSWDVANEGFDVLAAAPAIVSRVLEALALCMTYCPIMKRHFGVCLTN